MSVHGSNPRRLKGKCVNFIGTWYIYEMEMWDEDYFNMEVQAYIKIVSNSCGDFQFGLVSGEIDGKVVRYANEKGLNLPGREMMNVTRSVAVAGLE